MKRNNVVVSFFLGFILFASLLCTKNDKSQTRDQPTEKKEQTEVNYRIISDKTATLNPHDYQLTVETDVMELIYSSLLQAIIDPKTIKLSFIPYDAVKLPERNDDGTVWTFTIKKGLTWSNGEPLDANDYEYSYKMLLDPKLKNSRGNELFGSELEIVNAKKYWNSQVDWSAVGIKALDDYTLELTFAFSTPEIDIVSNFGYPGPLSPVYDKVYKNGMNDLLSETNYGTSVETTPSSGIFKMTEWIRDQYKSFEKRKECELAGIYTPDKITIRVSESSATKLQLFENNESDRVTLMGQNYEKYAEDPRLVFSEATGVRCMYINSDHNNKKFLGDNNFRKAMFWAMDRKTIAEEIYKTAAPATYIIASGAIVDIERGLRYRDTEAGLSVNVKNNGYDPDLAREFFDKAYKNYGKKMEIELQYFDGNNSMKMMGEYVEETFEKLFGRERLDITLRSVPVKSVYQNMREGNYEMAFGRWNAGRFNPWSFLVIHTSEHEGKLDRMRNAQFDALLSRCLTGNLVLQPEQRIKALADLENIMIEELPKIPIYEDRYPSLIHERITLITKGKFVPGVGFGILQSKIAGYN